MKVNWYYADTYWEDEQTPEPKWTIIGVLKGEWISGMEDTYLDSKTIYWFDTDEEVLNLKKGSHFGDGLIIDSIDYMPDYRKEEFEITNDI